MLIMAQYLETSYGHNCRRISIHCSLHCNLCNNIPLTSSFTPQMCSFTKVNQAIAVNFLYSQFNAYPKGGCCREASWYIVSDVEECLTITLTRPCNIHPRKPHFKYGKVVFTRVLIIFLNLVQKHRLRLFVTTASTRCFFFFFF